MSKKQILLFVLILILASFLRLFKLGDIPKYLNRDETSLGYTAYSILRTGHDEHGVYYPINIESFGDWKLPGYVYGSIIFIKLFGLTAFSTRLLASISGIFIVILAFLISKKIFKNNNIALLSMFFTATAPWAIHMSRIAYEANFALFLFLTGLYFFLKGLKKPIYLFFTSFSFVLAVFTYHAYQVFIPVFSIYLLFNNLLFFKKLFKFNKKILIINLVIIISGIILLLFSKTGSAVSTKFSGLSILDFSHPNIFINNIINNFFNLFSYDFLVKTGGVNTAHNIAKFGNIYLSTLLLATISLLTLIKKNNSKIKFLGIWILISAIAPMLTFEANHTIRASSMFISFEILASFSLYKLIISKKYKFLIILIFLFIFYFINYLHQYFIISPIQDSDRFDWYMKDIAIYINNEKNNYKNIYFNASSSSPYIYYLFYTQYDPKKLLNNIEYFPVDKEGFKHVKKLENISYEPIEFNQLENESNNILFILRDKDVSQDKKENQRYQMIGSLNNPFSKIKYEFWQLD